MNQTGLKTILEQLRNQELTVEETLGTLKDYYYEDIGHAKVDHHRAMRNGMPEVIFGPGKTPQQVADIAVSLWNKQSNVLVTKASREQYLGVKSVISEAVFHELRDQEGIIVARCPSTGLEAALDSTLEPVAILSAGTADLPVAEEAALVLEFLGITVKRFYDVGVAGLHRLLDKITEISSCKAVIVVAGMDGALPSVVAGMIDAPVIAVPTSVGYGASFSGIAPLLTMLNSCAPGVGVVNIDNGFGAAALAYSIIYSGSGDAKEGTRRGALGGAKE